MANQYCLKPDCDCPDGTCAMEALEASGIKPIIIDEEFDFTTLEREMWGRIMEVVLINNKRKKKLIGFQICNNRGVNIQGDPGTDPTKLASFEVIPINLLQEYAERFPNHLWMPIFQDTIEEPVIVGESDANK